MRRLAIMVAAVGMAAALMPPASAQMQTCAVDDASTKEVLSGVTLTWDSSFRCTNAPDQGTYEIEVTVANAAGSSEAVKIKDLKLKDTTPKPRGRAPMRPRGQRSSDDGRTR
jgi:archaellin